MSVKTDFNYLRSQISRKGDLAKLEAIAADRKRVRFNDAVLTDTSLIDIRFDNMLFYFRKDLAPGSIDTYIEIFRDRAHMKIPEFQPENCSTVLDIGANEGFYSLYMQSHNPGLRILSVEPVPAAFDLLCRNIRANGFNTIQPINAAVHQKDGTGQIETYPHVSSISSADIMCLQRPWTRPDRIQTIAVQTITLPLLLEESGLNKVDILKIDTEGSEWDILSSSESMVEHVNKIVLEWHTPELKRKCTRFLLEHSFTLVYEEQRKIGDSYFIKMH